MSYDNVVLDDATSAFHHSFSVTQLLRTEQLCCPNTRHGAASVRHSTAATSSRGTCGCPRRCERCPDKMNAKSHQAVSTTTTTTLIWSPARDIENEQRSDDETGKHFTNNGGHKR